MKKFDSNFIGLIAVKVPYGRESTLGRGVLTFMGRGRGLKLVFYKENWRYFFELDLLQIYYT